MHVIKFTQQGDFWGDRALEERMRVGWIGGLPFTPCGRGSRPEHSAKARSWLPSVIARYGIGSLCEAGAGDGKWLSDALADSEVTYAAFDLVPRHSSVKRCDISQEELPACDAILCRQVLIHLDPVRIRNALRLFKASAPYLIASQYENPGRFNQNSQFNATDLAGEYGLGEPLERVQDSKEQSCFLAIWKF